MTNCKGFHLFLFPLSLFFGCSPIYYAPNSQPVPMHRKKGDISVALNFDKSRGEFQGNLAIRENWTLLLDGGFVIPQADSQGDDGSGHFLELGYGTFRNIANNFYWQLFGLAGFGSVENNFPSTLADNPGTTGFLQAKMFRYGLQPAIYWGNKYLECALSARIVHLRYFGIAGSLVFEGEDQVQYLAFKKGHFLLEPALTLRLGYDPIKLQFQAGSSRNLSHPKFRQQKNYSSIGLIYQTNFK